MPQKTAAGAFRTVLEGEAAAGWTDALGTVRENGVLIRDRSLADVRERSEGWAP
jgi:hypothetical protein